MTGRVILAPYDPEWPRRFDQEAVVLGAVFAGSDAAIEHVGSTAVLGLGAKPVIDIMVGLSHLVQAESRMGALEAEGYEYVQKHEKQFPQRRYFASPGSVRVPIICTALSEEAISGFAYSRFATTFVRTRKPPRPTAS